MYDANECFFLYLTIGVKKDWVLGNIASCRTGFVVFIFTMSMMDTSSLCFFRSAHSDFYLDRRHQKKNLSFFADEIKLLGVRVTNKTLLQETSLLAIMTMSDSSK